MNPATVATPSLEPPTGTVTLMFTDIVGSTALRDQLVAAHGEQRGDEAYRQRVLDLHNERIRPLLTAHNGFEVKTNGDAFMAAFATPAEAVECAVSIQRSFHEAPVPTSAGDLSVRIGMHTGQPFLYPSGAGGDYDGHAVNIAARIEGLLKGGGQILCSEATRNVAGNLPTIRYHSCGVYELKGVRQPPEVIEVLWHAEQQPNPPARPDDSLPYPWLTEWVGRRATRDELAAALNSGKLVTLLGTGGVGKTRLAVETLLPMLDEFPDGVYFLPLAEVANDLPTVLERLRQLMDLTEADAPTVDDLRHNLRGKRCLFVFDNFESVMAAAVLPRMLATLPGVRVLLTSQQSLLLAGERVVSLDPMPTQGTLAELDSYRLFLQLAQSGDSTWQADDEASLRALLTLTDGLPYLIEIVAPKAARLRLEVAARELRAQLTDVQQHDPLLPLRHQSVRACLAWSLSHTPAEAQAALPKLSVFAGSFTAAAAQEVSAVARATLDALLDHSLLQYDRATDRYALLTTTQMFAAARLQNPNELQQQHAQFYFQLLDRADDALRAPGGEPQRQARLSVATEQENIDRALAWSQQHDVSMFRKLVVAYSLYLSQRAAFSLMVKLTEQALVGLSERDFPTDWAMTQNNLGTAYNDLPTGDRAHNLQQAIACYEAALRVYTERDFPTDWAATQNNLGTAYSDLSTGDRAHNLQQAIACYEAALRVRTERDFPTNWAMTQFNLALLYREDGPLQSFEVALACARDAERGFTASGHQEYAQRARALVASLSEDAS